MRILFAAIAALLLLLVENACADDDLVGRWECALESPGGKLAFGLSIESKTDGAITAFVVNGSERIEIPDVRVDDGRLRLRFTHYDSEINCRLLDGILNGDWRKRRGSDEWIEMKFSAVKQDSARGTQTSGEDNGSAERFAGRWAVDFAGSDDPAVGIFTAGRDSSLSGTFLTTTGDYRYLHGDASGENMRLSCFDGAHAFLFHARWESDQLSGEFWSSTNWQEKWTATGDANAALPNAFSQTRATQTKPIGEYAFPDLSGKPTRLDDPKYAARAKLIYVFGSWCPNCHDAAAYFAELKKKFKDEDLAIVGLAFELTGDFERNANQVREYLERHKVQYPVLIAGPADKKLASAAIPFLDQVRSYPTTIFLDADNTVKFIHTGFCGPATGKEYELLKHDFETRIEQIIADAD